MNEDELKIKVVKNKDIEFKTIYSKLNMVEYLERIEKKVDEGNQSKKKYLKWLLGLSIIGILIKLGADLDDIGMVLDLCMTFFDLM